MDDLQQCEVKAGTLAMRAYDLLRQEIVSGRVVMRTSKVDML